MFDTFFVCAVRHRQERLETLLTRYATTTPLNPGLMKSWR